MVAPSYRSLLVATLLGACVLAPRSALAEETTSTGKGIVGGALLGAEAVTLVEGAFGVKPGWAYAVGGVVGAAGGGVGGYFVEGAVDPKISLYMLAGGMALIIPTTVVVLGATQYDPAADVTEDGPVPEEPVAEPATTDAEPAAEPAPVSQRRPTRRAPIAPLAALPPALVGVGEGALSLSVPSVEVRQRYSPREVAEFGVEQATEYRLSVLSVVF